MNYNIAMNKKFNISIILIGFIIIIGLLFCLFSNKTLQNNLSIPRDKIIKQLEEKYESNPKINYILNNVDEYPDGLLKLLSQNIETIDFVYNYPNRSLDVAEKSFSVKEYYTPGKIPLFLQWDEKWGYDKYGYEYIAVGGCAPTCLSMVAVGITGNTNINPLYVSNYAYDNGYYVDGIGSSWNLISKGAKHFGLNSQELPLSKSSILSTLEDGNPIIITVGPGTFTSTGHFIVLTGLTDDGKIKINDPNSKLNSSKSWDVDIFLKEAKNLWKISKL